MKRRYYSTNEIATILGCSGETVRTWCRDGTILDAVKHGHRWFIPANSDFLFPAPKPEITHNNFPPGMTAAEKTAAYRSAKGVMA